MSDDAEYSHVLHKISGVSNLTREQKNHKYVEEFLVQWNIIFAYGTYLLEGEIAARVDPSFSASETWSLMQDPHVTLSNSDKNFRRQMVNFMCALKYIQCIEGQLTSEDIKTLHKLMMDGEKHKNGRHVLIGEFRKTPVFAGFHQFAPAFAIPKLVKDALDRYYSNESDDPILNAVNLFADLINVHPFEDGNGRLCRLIISHVLMKSGQSLFPVLLSSFHKRGRRHYIQAIKRFRECPSMFYTLVCTSLVKVWENFEQNLVLMERSPNAMD